MKPGIWNHQDTYGANKLFVVRNTFAVCLREARVYSLEHVKALAGKWEFVSCEATKLNG